MSGCAGLNGGHSGQGGGQHPSGGRRLEAEWERHAFTLMSWPTERIWAGQVDEVREDVARLASGIVAFEPVTMIVSPEDADAAAQQCGQDVEMLPVPVEDLWARDTAPVFVRDGDGVSGVDFHFNGWGGKQEHERDSRVASAVLDHFHMPRIEASLVAEGGSFETDGAGTLLATKSSLVNENRNPGLSQQQIEAKLLELLGVQRMIWFDGVYGQDITDAHVDCLARFVAPGVVLLDVPGPGAPDDVWAQASRQAREVLTAQRDARGERFEVVELPQPDFSRIRGDSDEFLASYANFYIANGAVFVPEFGDRPADATVQRILQEHFADRQIVPVAIDTIASGGGGIHCATHDVPDASGTGGGSS